MYLKELTLRGFKSFASVTTLRFEPGITALTWDLAAVGKSMAQLMLRRLDGPADAEPERIVITTQLVLRDSCGPVPAARPAARPAAD